MCRFYTILIGTLLIKDRAVDSRKLTKFRRRQSWWWPWGEGHQDKA